MAVNEQASPLSSDEEELHRLGYAQELRRRMSGFSNFAVSFTIISILSGCLTLYGFGMNTGGPVVIVWGWPFVGIMTLFVGLAMAEVCSSFPTAGGLYYWAAKLAPNNGAAWAWFTGWFNFLGQVAVTAGIDFGCALLHQRLPRPAVERLGIAHRTSILVYAVVLALHGLLNQFGVRLVALLNDVSVWWHLLGVLIIVGVLAFTPAHHQSASFVFTKFVNNTGFSSGLYVVLIGLLLAQYTFTGYDASAHMTEETHDAAPQRPARHRQLDHRLADRRVDPADRDHLRDPELLRRGRLGHRRAAGPDLHRRARRHRRQAAAADRDRRPAVLRHVLGDGQLADDLRVLP